MFLDCCHVCKTCAFHDALQVGNRKNSTHRTLLIWRTFCRRGGNPRTVTAALRSIPKEAFAESFPKLYERFQQRVVKDGDYIEGQ
jgi:hypothetical protein